MKSRKSIPGGLLQAHREHKRLVEEYQVGLRVMHKVVLIFGEHWCRQALKRSWRGRRDNKPLKAMQEPQLSLFSYFAQSVLTLLRINGNCHFLRTPAPTMSLHPSCFILRTAPKSGIGGSGATAIQGSICPCSTRKDSQAGDLACNPRRTCRTDGQASTRLMRHQAEFLCRKAKKQCPVTTWLFD